jgi:hypothetical protein
VGYLWVSFKSVFKISERTAYLRPQALVKTLVITQPLDQRNVYF